MFCALVRLKRLSHLVYFKAGKRDNHSVIHMHFVSCDALNVVGIDNVRAVWSHEAPVMEKGTCCAFKRDAENFAVNLSVVFEGEAKNVTENLDINNVNQFDIIFASGCENRQKSVVSGVFIQNYIYRGF